MELVLKSKLSNLAPCLGRSDQLLGVLLVYEDIGFVNSTMELLRDATSRIEATGRLFCTIWGFGFFEDPLLRPIAAREAAAADVIIIAERYKAGLPNDTKVCLGLRASMDKSRLTEIAAPDFPSNLHELGHLGGITLLALAGHGSLTAEFMEEIKRDLAHSSHEFLDAERACFWLGRGAPEKEHLRRSRTAHSGCPTVPLSATGRCKKTAATERMLI